MILWGTSPPSSGSAGFLNKGSILYPVAHLSIYWPVMQKAVRAWTQFSSVQSLSCVPDSLWPHESQHTRPLSITNSRSPPNSCPSSQWCHPTISSSVIPFSSCPQLLLASGSFQMSQLFARLPKYWSFSFSISPSNEYSGLISCIAGDPSLIPGLGSKWKLIPVFVLENKMDRGTWWAHDWATSLSIWEVI